MATKHIAPVTLPTIPADATALGVDTWTEEDGTEKARIFDRTGLEDYEGEWGTDLGEVTYRADADRDDLDTALRALGFIPGEALPYSLPEGDGTVTTWTR